MDRTHKPTITETGVQRFFEKAGNETPAEMRERQERCRKLMEQLREQQRRRWERTMSESAD